MTAQMRAAGNDSQTPQGRLAARVRQQEESSRNMRELLEGLDKDEMIRRHPEGTGRETSNLRSIKRNMKEVLLREEEHRCTIPKPGDGAHYLKGDPPFWRQPWPANWQVPKPWEFAENYDQKEMQQILKNPDLTEFSGHKPDYAQWQRMFHQAVHVQDIDVNRKYNLLLKYISPTVKSSITGGLGRSPNDYCFAVVRLERNYGLGTQRPETEVESITTFRPLTDRDLTRAKRLHASSGELPQQVAGGHGCSHPDSYASHQKNPPEFVAGPLLFVDRGQRSRGKPAYCAEFPPSLS